MSIHVRAALNADRSIVLLRDGKWRGDFSVADLDRWISFYHGLWSRKAKDKNQPGPWAEFYRPTVEALERVKAKLGEKDAR